MVSQYDLTHAFTLTAARYFYVTGTLDESQPQPDVRDVTGREPRTSRQWAQAHAIAFRPG